MDLKAIASILSLTDYLPRRHRILSQADDLSCDPFFIVGSGRNGSTLISAMLSAHSQIMLPTEQWRFPNMVLKYKLYNFLPWKELVSIIIGEIAASNSALKWDLNFNKTLETLQYLPRSERSLQRIFDEVYVLYGTQHQESFRIWGEKSPKNMPFMKTIYKVFPKGRYIFLVRDGRDVCRSWLLKNKSTNIKWIAESWNESIAIYEWLQKRLGEDQLTMVKYEDLVSDTEEVLKGLSRFLNVEFEPQMTYQFEGYVSKIEGEQVFSHFTKLKQPANQSSIGLWKSYFSSEDSEFLNKLIQPNLKKMGYEQ